MKNVAKNAVGVVLMGGLLLLPVAAAQAQVRSPYMNNLMANAQMMPGAPWGGGGFAPQVFNPGAGSNPYMPGSWGAGSNPYMPGGFGGSGGGYSSSGSIPYTYGTVIPPAGYFLMGTADIMKAYSSVVTADQQARIMAEQANQAHIDTLKKRFEYQLFIEANTIPYSEKQAKWAQQTLERVRRAASPSEVTSGKSVNIILQDLEGAQGKKIDVGTITLSEDVLKHLNVTTRNGNLGLLRNDGRFTWPPALLDLVPAKEREEIEIQAQSVVQKALMGVVPGDALRDLQNTLENLDSRLRKKLKEGLSGDDYRIAMRFLEDFNSARVGLSEPGNAEKYFSFQKWATGGKSVQDVVDYMVKSGLRFAPAVQGDEAAYRALQGALAAYDNAYRTQTAPPQTSKDE
jgi:hypothetical protein